MFMEYQLILIKFQLSVDQEYHPRVTIDTQLLTDAFSSHDPKCLG